MNNPIYTTYRIYDENQIQKEYGNRIYQTKIGFRWVILKDGKLSDDNDGNIFKTFKQVQAKFPTVLKSKEA